MPLVALEDRRIRGEFKSWRDRFANTPRKAEYAWITLGKQPTILRMLSAMKHCFGFG